jgi:hypothetical protein
MLRFFRSLRQRLLTENKFSRYLLYAIGEILLVVIGILIALQVNNWNEERKTKLTADTYKSKLINDLVSDTLNINRLIASGATMQEGIEDYFSAFVSQDLSVDTFLIRSSNVSTSFFRYFPINHTFEDMQNTGNSALLSEEQRQALNELYNEQQFLMVIIDKSIEDIKYYVHERNRYLDNDLAKNDFFDKVLWEQDHYRKKQGLLFQHNVLTGFHKLIDYFNTNAEIIKEKSEKCLILLSD